MLTGQDTDRLEQEKRRGISIELGFASMTLPGGSTLAFIDVPGHERFIRQMLAGAGGIESFLLVVAADEGIKPQTREHADILRLLNISQGAVALTKIDLVSEHRVEQVRAQVEEFLETMGYADVPVIPVSSVTGEGLDILIHVLDEMTAKLPPRASQGKMRMPVDRAFSLKGVGPVATGTIWSGRISIGDQLEVLPVGQECRVRGIQEHGKPVAEAGAGHRAAVNISGLNLETLKRGCVLQTPGYLQACTRGDLCIQLLPTAEKSLQHGERLRFYHGTAEVLGRVILLEGEELLPGQQGYAQCVLESPLTAAVGDRLVIRTYSPMRTIAGAVVISTCSPKRKRGNAHSLKAISTLHTGSSEEKMCVYIEESPLGMMPVERLAGLLQLTPQDILDLCLPGGALLEVTVSDQSYITCSGALDRIGRAVLKVLRDYHEKHPLRVGLSRDEVRSKAFSGYTQGEWTALLGALEARGLVASQGVMVRDKDFYPGLGKKQQAKAEQIEARLLTNPFQPLLWSLISKELFFFNPQEGEEIRQYLEDTGVMIQMEEDLYFHRDAVARAQGLVREHLEQQGSITSAQARDLLGSSRKFVIPLMEYFDAQGFTLRKGNERVLAGEDFIHKP